MFEFQRNTKRKNPDLNFVLILMFKEGRINVLTKIELDAAAAKKKSNSRQEKSEMKKSEPNTNDTISRPEKEKLKTETYSDIF